MGLNVRVPWYSIKILRTNKYNSVDVFSDFISIVTGPMTKMKHFHRLKSVTEDTAVFKP